MTMRRFIVVASVIILVAGVVAAYQTVRARAVARRDADIRKQLSGLAAPARRSKPVSLRTDRP